MQKQYDKIQVGDKRMENIKNFLKRIFTFERELTREEEQEVVAKIFKKIRESEV